LVSFVSVHDKQIININDIGRWKKWRLGEGEGYWEVANFPFDLKGALKKKKKHSRAKELK